MRKNVLITGAGGFIGKSIRGGKAFTGDITKIHSIWRQTKGVSGIVHLAAVSSRKLCQENPRDTIKINLLALCDVLEVALRRRIWVLFVSTFQVMDEHIYGLSKLIGEEICRIYQMRGLKVRILRLPIVYGPGDRPYKIVTKIISEVKTGKIPKIDTRRKFQFLYVKDAVKLIEKEVNVLSCRKGKKYSLYELVTGIRKCLAKREGK